MKLIGLDVGTKRIGVAKADSKVKIAVPQCTISVDGTEIDQLSRLSRVYDAKFFVIGLPRNAGGEETQQSQYSRDFAKSLKKAIPGAKICFQDESLTSVEAENRLKNRKKGYKKEEIDSEAASMILQDFLENFSEKKIKKSSSGTSVAPKRKRHFDPRLNKSDKKLFLIIAAIAGSLLMTGVIAAIIYNGSLTPVAGINIDCSTTEATNANPESCRNKNLIIEEGMTTAEIADALKERDLIQNPFTFRLYVFLKGLSTQLKTGRYEINKTMSVQEIVAMLADGSAGVVTFRITTIPGETLSDFVETLKINGYTTDQINAGFAAVTDHPVLKSRPAGASLEGYIFGETLEFVAGSSVETIVRGFLDELYSTITSNNFEEKFAAHGLTLHEGITLASIVQKEAKSSDMAGVAGVFYNRLSNGMALGSDVTVTYALDQVDPNRTTYTDNAAALQIDSCYNTRIYAGLPCGPISNPGVTALRAVAEPQESPYLYFLTGDDGIMYYSSTENEHVQNALIHCQTLCNVSL